MELLTRYKLSVLVLANLLSYVLGYLEVDGWLNIELSHALNPAEPDNFSYRGNITISSLNSGLSNGIQEALSEDYVKKVEYLAEKKDFYRLKAKVGYPNGNSYTYMTSASACGLLLSQLNDVLWISIDGSGFVTSVSETPALSNINSDDCSGVHLMSNEFNTDVLIKHTELAPVPDTASFIQKVEREREARERGETRDNRTFFAKYWMYIVPVVLLLLISGATNQEPAK